MSFFPRQLPSQLTRNFPSSREHVRELIHRLCDQHYVVCVRQTSVLKPITSPAQPRFAQEEATGPRISSASMVTTNGILSLFLSLRDLSNSRRTVSFVLSHNLDNKLNHFVVILHSFLMVLSGL